jgi:hypothetical protein
LQHKALKNRDQHASRGPGIELSAEHPSLLSAPNDAHQRVAVLESRLRDGALIIADNADYSPDYLARVRPPAKGYLSTPFAEDVELSMRVG